MHEDYTVTFVEQPNFHSLNFSEDKWYNQLIGGSRIFLRKAQERVHPDI